MAGCSGVPDRTLEFSPAWSKQSCSSRKASLRAALIALLIIPAINARADRLARRRGSHVPALDLGTDRGKDTCGPSSPSFSGASSGRPRTRSPSSTRAWRNSAAAVRIEALETEVAGRDSMIAELSHSTETATRLVAAEEELASSTTPGSGLRDAGRDRGCASPDPRRTGKDPRRGRAPERDPGEHQERNSPSRRTVSRSARPSSPISTRATWLRSAISTPADPDSDLGTRLVLQTDRCNDFERSLADRRRELSRSANALRNSPRRCSRSRNARRARKSGSGDPRRTRCEVRGGGRSHGPPADALRRRRTDGAPSTSMRRRSNRCGTNSTTPVPVSPPSRAAHAGRRPMPRRTAPRMPSCAGSSWRRPTT